jgi:hypothetical protein
MSIQNTSTIKHFIEIEISREVDRAIKRGQRVGVVYCGGNRWDWQVVEETDVVIEFERSGKVVERHAVPWQSWQAFKIVAAGNGMDARDYLVALLGNLISEGESVAGMVRWIFKR